MTPRGEQEVQVRRFLLGQLDESEQQWVEETLMVDTNFREQVLLGEETLIEDYVDGALSPGEKKAFESYFAASIQQRHKVKIAKLLNTYELPNAPHVEATAVARVSRWQSWPIGFMGRNRALVFTCVAAALLSIIAFGVFQGVRLWRESRLQIEARQQKLQIERELTQLSNTPAQDLNTLTFALALAPVALRNANDASTLSLPVASEILELRLILSGDTYPRYLVGLNRIGGAETYRIQGLNAQQTANGQAVVVRIPARLLNPGDYKLSLIGIAADGTETRGGEYVFHAGS
jgi:hypothetical protein